MGGTSSDICLIRNAQPSMRQEREIARLAGAGSQSWTSIPWAQVAAALLGSTDRVLLKVGPQSAGAQPGPAAYGRGGELPTVTDANVVLNRLPA